MQVFPEFVSYSAADDLYGVDYAGFSVVAIKAIQEQKTLIESQQETLERQEKEMRELKARLERIEGMLLSRE